MFNLSKNASLELDMVKVLRLATHDIAAKKFPVKLWLIVSS